MTDYRIFRWSGFFHNNFEFVHSLFREEPRILPFASARVRHLLKEEASLGDLESYHHLVAFSPGEGQEVDCDICFTRIGQQENAIAHRVFSTATADEILHPFHRN